MIADYEMEYGVRFNIQPYTGSYSQADALKLLKFERRVELAFENHRFFDTRTWKIAEECDGGKMWGMNVETTGSGDVTPDSFWERTVFEKRVFKKQHYLYPFTQTEISLNKQLTQNYGW